MTKPTHPTSTVSHEAADRDLILISGGADHSLSFSFSGDNNGWKAEVTYTLSW